MIIYIIIFYIYNLVFMECRIISNFVEKEIRFTTSIYILCIIISLVFD